MNGSRVTGKVRLNDGDVIGVARERVTFSLSDELPANALNFDIADDGSNPGCMHNGILTQCGCGAPLWVPASMAGAFGRCAVCKGDITVPGTPVNGERRTLSPNDSLADEPALTDLGSIERPEDPLAAELLPHEVPTTTDMILPRFPRPQPAAAVKQRCKACHNQIMSRQKSTTCPACGQSHHKECWENNGGCASYGCTHSAQNEQEPQKARSSWQDHVETPARPATPAGAVTPVTMDIALLGGSLCGLILGAFTFGVPSLAVGTASTVFAIRRRDAAGRVAALSAGISVVGVAIGIVISNLLWFSRPFWAH